MREVLEGIEDGMEAALISLDQSKAFDRVDHRFLASVLETAGFQPGVRDRAFGPAGLPPVSSSLCPRFGAPAL